MAMLYLLAICFLPLWIGWRVTKMFKDDIRYVQNADKLKTGDIETMLRRHKAALWMHGTFTLFASITLFWIMGIAGIILEIPFLLILGAHLNAYNDFHSSIKITYGSKRKNEDISRLVEAYDFDEQAIYTVGDDGELVEVKEQKRYVR